MLTFGYDAGVSVITRLKPSKRSPTRQIIVVDGKSLFSLSSNQIEELGLAEGTPWTEAVAERAERARGVDKAMGDAMRRLNRRAYSCRQMRDKLRQRDHDDAVIDEVIERLTSRRLLDDEAFGRAAIRELLLRKPAGKRLIIAKMLQKGLERTLAERLADEALEDRDSTSEARQLVERRLSGMRRLDAVTRKRRLWGMLARRGFDSDTIQQAMADLPDDNDDDDVM